jgi:hypothetical protein
MRERCGLGRRPPLPSAVASHARIAASSPPARGLPVRRLKGSARARHGRRLRPTAHGRGRSFWASWRGGGGRRALGDRQRRSAALARLACLRDSATCRARSAALRIGVARAGLASKISRALEPPPLRGRSRRALADVVERLGVARIVEPATRSRCHAPCAASPALVIPAGAERFARFDGVDATCGSSLPCALVLRGPRAAATTWP